MLRERIICPVLSIRRAVSPHSATATPSEKPQTASYRGSITTCPVLSIKPHPPPAWTAASSSEKPIVESNCGSIIWRPDLSIYPHLLLNEQTGASPSEKLPAR